jgi:glutaconate CoA-transferase subunit B
VNCTPQELYVAALARGLGDSRHVAVGSASPYPAAAAWLAHLASGGRMRVSMLGGRSVFITDGGKELFDCAASGRIDAFFLSGGQIDGEANINLMGTGRYPELKVRWGGTYGAPYLYALAKRVVLFRDEHTPRVLTRKVDFVTAAGTNASNVYRPGGPRVLVTSRCVFGFAPERKRFTLESVHPGQTPADIRRETGFDYDLPAGTVPTTAVPSAEILSLLRNEVAPLLVGTYPQFAREVLGHGVRGSAAVA